MKISSGYSSHIKNKSSEREAKRVKMKSQWKCAKAKREITHFHSNSFPRVRSIQPMLGDWERYFSRRPFCLTRPRMCHSEVCLSAVCIVWRRNNNTKYMTRNPMSISTDRAFRFSWLPESIGNIRKCLFDRISNPLERKTLSVPPSPYEICLFQTPLPLGISVTLRGGGGMDIFWNHTMELCNCSFSYDGYTCSSCNDIFRLCNILLYICRYITFFILLFSNFFICFLSAC